MPKMKLADWARVNGLSYITAHRHFHAGMIPNAHQLDSGTILVEIESPEQTMAGNSSNDAMSLFLKKTVEFSKNGASVEDFAAYVISNFSLKLASTSEGPRYSRQKPKAEDVQKHFQQFIPKGEKPQPNSFVMDPKEFEEIAPTTWQDPNAPLNVNPDLVKEFSQAVEHPTTPLGITAPSTPANATTPSISGATSAEGTVTRSVDLNTTPQPINYTGSNNPTFSSSLSYVPFTGVETMTGALIAGMGEVTTAFVNSNASLGMVAQSNSFGGTVPSAASKVFYTNSLDSTLEEISEDEPVITAKSKLFSSDARLSQPRKRGRKPSKR